MEGTCPGTVGVGDGARSRSGSGSSDSRSVEKGRWSHMKWGVEVEDFPGLGHGQESHTG